MKSNKRKRFCLFLVLVIAGLIVAFLVYVNVFYHEDHTALDALESDSMVAVVKTDYGWLFDGPSDTDALIFYPGAKVEETAYASLLHSLAGEGMDVCLVKMPFRLAFFGTDKADDIIPQYSYENWYIGGHSLGGAMAANYAADHEENLAGLILLAAYPTEKLGDSLMELSIYGSEDGVLDMEKVNKGKDYAPDHFVEYIIQGGNHAQFGNYGEQFGDGIASISAEKQQELTVDCIIENTVWE